MASVRSGTAAWPAVVPPELLLQTMQHDIVCACGDWLPYTVTTTEGSTVRSSSWPCGRARCCIVPVEVIMQFCSSVTEWPVPAALCRFLWTH